jgi:hypothetical protein
MPSLLDPDYQFGQSPLPGASGGAPTDLLGQPLQVLGTPPDTGPDQGAALGQTYQMITDAMARQREQSRQMGLLGDDGLPTQAGMVDAARQYAQGVMMGTTAPELRLQRIGSWEGVGADNLDKHSYLIKGGPEQSYIGSLDTTWNPARRELQIADVRADEGANSFGIAGVRQLREAILAQYPGAKLISGNRISGAGPNRQATQKVSQ